MDIKKVVTGALALANANSAEIALGISLAGVPISMVLAGNARLKADDILAELEDERWSQGIVEPVPTKDKVKATWHCYILPFVAGSATLACMILSHRIQGKKLIALASAYTLTDSALRDLKAHIPEKKLLEYQQTADQEKASTMSVLDSDILSTNTGDVLCIDSWSGQKFFSNAESIRQAVASINSGMFDETYKSLNDFYSYLNIPWTEAGEDNGWNVLVDKKISVDFSSVLDKENIPALVMHLSPNPRPFFNDL